MTPGRQARVIGDQWEAKAREFLQSHGVRIITSGFRCRLGELDLIATDDAGLIIVEVRARSGKCAAAASIGPHKQRRIINATRYFLMQNPAWSTRHIRFDVIAFDEIDTATPKLSWIRNAFDAA